MKEEDFGIKIPKLSRPDKINALSTVRDIIGEDHEEGSTSYDLYVRILEWQCELFAERIREIVDNKLVSLQDDRAANSIEEDQAT